MRWIVAFMYDDKDVLCWFYGWDDNYPSYTLSPRDAYIFDSEDDARDTIADLIARGETAFLSAA